MNVADITQLIGSLGFPIIMCLILNKDLKEERQLHKEEVEKLTEVIERNTNTLERVEVKINDIE